MCNLHPVRSSLVVLHQPEINNTDPYPNASVDNSTRTNPRNDLARQLRDALLFVGVSLQIDVDLSTIEWQGLAERAAHAHRSSHQP